MKLGRGQAFPAQGDTWATQQPADVGQEERAHDATKCAPVRCANASVYGTTAKLQ